MLPNPENSFRDSEGDRRRTRRPLRWQILSIAIIGTLGFFLYLAVTLLEAKDRADLLKDIRDFRYPAQEHLLAALHGLEFIDSSLEHAFISSNSSLHEHSMILANEFRANLHKAMILEHSSSQQIKVILERFDEYFSRSHSLAQDIISNKKVFSETTIDKQENARLFNILIELLGDLQTSQSATLVASVDAATRRASEALRVGVTAGLLTALLLFLVAFVTTRSILIRINHMVQSLREIAVGKGDMDERIALTGSDEMTELAFWFNTFIEKLQSLTEESTAEIKRLAYTDTLTNLPNRRLFLRCLESEIERSGAQANIAVLFLDLDNFKPINDQLGHDAGDDLIREVATRLTSIVGSFGSGIGPVIEASAPVEGGSVVARLAGDEFMIIVTNIESQQQAADIAEQIRVSILEPYKIRDIECTVGVSIGICMYPENARLADELVTNADIAMYEAKKNGKNTFRFFDPQLRAASEHKLKADNAIRNAIPNGELHLFFQPIVRLTDGELVGAEALLRWENPELGEFSPDEFIARAEANGLICDLDDWVLQSVLRQMLIWERKGLRPIQVSINFSSVQASRPGLAKAVQTLSGRHRHLLQCLEIEITETSAIDNIDVVETNIKELQKLGIKISMDDFGAGHSSLTLLTHCEIDTLKIDKAVTREIETDKKSQLIVQSIIDLANKMDVSIVAEGIESEAQSNVLAKMNCDFGQGYYYSAPVGPVAFTAFLEDHDNRMDRAA